MRDSYAKELQLRAIAWAEARDALDQAQRREETAKSERESAASQFHAINEEMCKCVGQNIPTKLFDLGDRRMVLVQHHQGPHGNYASASIITPEDRE